MRTRLQLVTWGMLLALVVTAVLPPIAQAQPAARGRASEIIHRVRRGETLASIAARYHISIAQLAAYNGLRNPNFVYVGQRLRIPGRQSQPTPYAASFKIHIVRPGEYLALIAARYGTTVNAILRANRLLNRNVLYVGQRLRIPVPSSRPPTPTPQTVSKQVAPAVQPPRLPTPVPTSTPLPTSTFTPRPIPQLQPTPVPQLQPTSTPTPTPTLAPRPTRAATSVPRIHVVRRGEFIASIARRYGVSAQALMEANHLRNPNVVYPGQKLLIPAREAGAHPSPTPVHTVSARRSTVRAQASGKWIDVNVRTQTLTAYEGNRAVLTTKVSTGLPRTPTVLGRFRIYAKFRAQTMSGPGYYLPNVPYVMYFYGGYSIHGTYWHHNFGHPMSHGCVNMRTSEARWLYGWAPVGTLVVIHR
ncbi:MAG: LysM peptidoglycan-binding domain-containing protein [Anaerolineae bacterium]|nr:LysM peptidoglycan-binding domain-containing protein [Anaerolineae bacterium]